MRVVCYGQKVPIQHAEGVGWAMGEIGYIILSLKLVRKG
jgi:hypothetical protein